MSENKKIKIVLLTSLKNKFITDLVIRFKLISEVDFENVIFWEKRLSALIKIKKNLRKHGILYIPWRVIRFLDDTMVKRIARFLGKWFLLPQNEENIFSLCSRYRISLYKTRDIHSPESIEFLTSLNCDIMAVCGTGILRKSVFNVPSIGTINLHQGKVPEYRGAPPGFWELWNGEKQAGVTIHFINEGLDTGDIILQRLVPIFDYDDLYSVQKKLEETALSLYPEAIRQITLSNNSRVQQPKGTGRQYFFPNLKQQIRLFLNIKRRQFKTGVFLKSISKKVLFPLLIFLIWTRDYFLRKRGKTILSVLYYHRITNICQDGMTVGVEEFGNQIRYLKKNYKVLLASELIELLDSESKSGNFLGKKVVLVTFDDGYEDNYINALPILTRYSCPAIFFVSTGLIGNEKQFGHDYRLYPQLTFRKMTWEQLQSVKKFNIEIGIHTHNHVNLCKISIQDGIKEIETSMEEYEKYLGRKPLFMSYPFGGKNDITADVIRYIKHLGIINTLFSAYGGKNISPFDRYNLKRTNIGSKDRGLIFLFKMEGGFQALYSDIP